MCAKNKGYFIVIDTFLFLPEKKLFFLFVFFLAKEASLNYLCSPFSARATGSWLEVSVLQCDQYIDVRCSETHGVSQERQGFPV
jgi:hypothetical protein